MTREIYNVVFDFLKKTYVNYRQGDRVSSPVEFFAVIQKIYGDFIKAADMILAQPHHVLETTHAVLPGHKVRRIDQIPCIGLKGIWIRQGSLTSEFLWLKLWL